MPFSAFDFMRLLQEVHQEHLARAPESMSAVIAVFGAKGGVGTTTLAYNIAAAIAAERTLRVALIDGSFQFGDVRTLLRVPEDTRSIVQLPTNRLQRTDIDEVVYRDATGVDVLIAPPRIEMAEMITARDIEKLIGLMRRLYNVVIIDTASIVDDVLLAFLDASDTLIQVVTYEAVALHQASAMAATLDAIGYPRDKVRYLVNRSDSTGGLSRDVVSEQIGRKPDFEVVSDGMLVVEANNRGEPFIRLGPDAPITKDIKRVAHELTLSLTPAGQAARGAIR